MTENTVRGYANYDYTTGMEMQPRAPSQLDLSLAAQQTTVPTGSALELTDPETEIEE